MSYHHLTRKERGKIALWNNNRLSIREIASRLGRSPSTISRELSRNTTGQRYRADDAQKNAQLRREPCHRKQRYKDRRIASYVQEKLLQCWSPEQIEGRMPLEYPKDPSMRVSCSSIYRWLHKGLLAQSAVLQLKLRHAGHRHGETRGGFHGIRELNTRSREALRRKRIGDWEVDTIVSSDLTKGACLLSVCDRKSRYCGLVLLHRRSSKEALRGFRFLFGSGKLPMETITGDRGKEFACYKEVEEELNVPFYFTRPHSPWQKPTVENLNGLVRQFFPRGTNFHEISPQEVEEVMQMLNNRPRKCLNFSTPEEVLHFT